MLSAMEAKHKSKATKRAARTLGAITSAFISIVSVVAFLTDEHLTTLDSILIFSAPFVMGAGAYFVGLYHNPSASE